MPVNTQSSLLDMMINIHKQVVKLSSLFFRKGKSMSWYYDIHTLNKYTYLILNEIMFELAVCMKE